MPQRSAAPPTIDMASPKRRRTDAALAETFAASRLQRVWRLKFQGLLTRGYAAAYIQPSDGLSADFVRSISFTELTCYLRQPRVLSNAKHLLERVHRLALFRHGMPPSGASRPDSINVRVFLVAHMIAHRPTHVFESMGPLEQALFDVAVPLVTNLESIARAVVEAGSFSGVHYELTDGFVARLFVYIGCFNKWRVPDAAKLTTRLKHALIALHQAQAQLPPDEPADSGLNVELNAQTARLRSKLKQIAGAGALEQLDQMQRQAPSVAVGVDAQGTTFPGRITNEQLAHELLLDPGFQLTDDGDVAENSVAQRIRASFHRAFWDSLADDLRLATPCFVRVLRVLREVRDGIAEVAGGRESGAINETIDLAFIERQVGLDVYSGDNCQNLVCSVVSIIRRIQSPRRDAELRTMWREVEVSMAEAFSSNGDWPRALCKALEFLLGRVSALRIDAANARLRLISPVIMDHGVDYERGKFQEKLSNGSLTLERAERWIADIVARETGASATIRLEDLTSGNPQAFIALHMTAMLSLVSDPVARINSDTVPETLLFDVRRLSNLQCEFDRIVSGITLLVVANHGIAEAHPSEEKRALMAELVALVEAGQVDYETIIGTNVAERISTLIADPDRVLRALRSSINDKSFAVRKLIANRVRSAAFEYMCTLQPVSDTRFVAAARSLVPLIQAAAAKLASLAGHNRAVHTPTYNRLIAEAAAKALVA